MVFRSLGFVILLVSLAATTLAETITVDVSITLIDTKRSSITVSYDGKSKQLELAKNVSVERAPRNLRTTRFELRSKLTFILSGDSVVIDHLALPSGDLYGAGDDQLRGNVRLLRCLFEFFGMLLVVPPGRINLGMTHTSDFLLRCGGNLFIQNRHASLVACG